MRSNIKRFFKGNYYIHSFFYSALQRFSTVFLGFANFFLLVRIYPKEIYGIWVLFTTVTSIIEMARNGLVKNPQIKFLSIARDNIEKKEISQASFYINFIYSILIILIILFASEILAQIWNAPELNQLLQIYALTNIILIFFSHSEYLLVSKLKFNIIFILHFIRHFSFFAVLAIIYITQFNFQLVNLAWIYFFTSIASSIFGILFTKDLFKVIGTINLKWFKRLFNYGRFTFGTSISSMLFRNVDQAFLGYLISPIAVAVYSIALKTTALIEAPSTAIANIVYPKSVEFSTNKDYNKSRILYEKSVSILITFILPIILIVLIFPEIIVMLLAGKQYTESIDILRVTVFYIIFIPFENQFGSILDSIGLAKINFRITLFKLIAASILNFYFIKNYGIIGASYGTLITFLLSFLINQYLVYKILGSNLFIIVKLIFKNYLRIFNLNYTKII